MSNPGIICPYCQAVFHNMKLYEEHIDMEQSDDATEEPAKK